VAADDSESSKQRVGVIKFGGSFATNQETGLLKESYFEDFFRVFANILIEQYAKVGLVIGGGPRVRRDQADAGNVSAGEKDRVAQSIMWQNAEKLRQIAGDYRLRVPSRVPHSQDEALRMILDHHYSVMIASWLKEGQSSDAVAAFLLRQLTDALRRTESPEEIWPLIVILSNVPFLFDKDPDKHTDSQPISFATLSTLEKSGIISSKLEDFDSGMNVPIDPVAVNRLLRMEYFGYDPALYFTEGLQRNFREVLLGLPFDPKNPRVGTRSRKTNDPEIHYFKGKLPEKISEN
jgi:uridylate kinase